MAIRPLRILSLCTGVGMLDLGVALALQAVGGRAAPVAYVKREAFAAAVLVARMAEASLGNAPVWDDLAAFDGRPWRGVVDCVLAGYPCQPFSQAGRRLGKADPRHLWPHVLRVVQETRPALAFFENVPGHVRCGFEEVRADLRAHGYRVQAGIFSSLAAGASHVRERLYILALADPDGVGRWREDDGGQPPGQSDSPGGDVGDAQYPQRRPAHPGGDGSVRRDAHHGEGPQGADRAGGASLALGNPEGHGRRQGRPQPARRKGQRLLAESGIHLADAPRHDRRRELEPEGARSGRSGLAGSGADMADADADGAGLERGRGFAAGGGAAESELARDRRAIYAPGPDDLAAWRAVLEHDPTLAPAIESAFYQLPHGVAPGLVQPLIPYRVDQLRCVGNGVDPHVAAEAFLTLLAACHGDEHP